MHLTASWAGGWTPERGGGLQSCGRRRPRCPRVRACHWFSVKFCHTCLLPSTGMQVSLQRQNIPVAWGHHSAVTASCCHLQLPTDITECALGSGTAQLPVCMTHAFYEPYNWLSSCVITQLSSPPAWQRLSRQTDDAAVFGKKVASFADIVSTCMC